MNFTPKIKLRRFGILGIVAVALTGWDGHAASTPIHAAGSVQPASHEVEAVLTPGSGTAGHAFYQPVSSSSTTHWLKRNAPILGGAGGGALVGGLVGGGTGAVVGGAAGAGGGYLYKRHQEHRRQERYRHERYNQEYYQHHR